MKILWALIASFGITAAVMPLVIALSKRLKLRQTILSYVDNHSGKSGTPTMGGIGFIIAIAVSALAFGYSRLSLIVTVVTIGYGIVGFTDDMIKVVLRRNEGLKPYQKIIFQLLIAGIVAFSAYTYSSEISLIFTTVDLKAFVIPLNIFLFLAFTNSVNLTDGLDGLASSVTLVSMLIMSVIIWVKNGDTSLVTFGLSVVGAMIAFLMFNGYPAKIFMGDTGSLALGGAFAAVAIYSGQVLASAMCGIMFVVSAVSVIIQVVYYKCTHKRVFLMAPFHHHLERKGLHENRIVAIYVGVTFFASLVALMLSVAF